MDENEDIEVRLCEFLVLLLVQDTVFESDSYHEAIDGFHHLFCNNLCIQKCILYPERRCTCQCIHNHVASRRTFYLVGTGSNRVVIDVNREVENPAISFTWTPRPLRYLTWFILLDPVRHYFHNRIPDAPYHLVQWRNTREQFSELLPTNVRSAATYLVPSLNEPYDNISFETIWQLGSSHWVRFPTSPFMNEYELWSFLRHVIINRRLPRTPFTPYLFRRLGDIIHIPHLAQFCRERLQSLRIPDWV